MHPLGQHRPTATSMTTPVPIPSCDDTGGRPPAADARRAPAVASLLVSPLAVFVGAAVLMTVFELVKSALAPALSAWESHTVTIVFGSVAATAAGVAVMRRLQGLIRRLAAELAERTRMTEELEQANALLQATIDAVPDGVVVVGLDGRILAYNRRLLDLWSLTPEQLAGGASDEVLLRVASRAKQPDEFVATIRRLRGDPNTSGDDIIEFADGRIVRRFWAPQRIDTRVAGRVWSYRDITQEHRDNQTMQMLAHTLRSVAECVSVTDMDDRVIFVNDAFLRTYGYDEAELVGHSIAAVRSPKNADELTSQILPATLAGGWAGELWNRRKGGSDFQIFLTTSIVRDGQGRPIALVGVARDVTNQKRTEEALRRGRELESVVTLAAGIAHQFNNLIQAISGHASLALDETPAGHPTRESLLRILHGSERAANLTLQLMAYAGRDVTPRVFITLDDLISERLSGLEQLLPPRCRLDVTLAPELPLVCGDALQLQQTVYNLVMNAAEALGGRPGAVAVRTGVLDIKEDDRRFDRVTGDTPPAGRYAFLEVSDTGSGMDEATLARVFDPFFTTKFLGRGLGLAAVLGIVRAHGGGLDIESAVGRGTTVTIVLPTAANGLAARPPA
jgi:two-component system, cell cycle sensor histidine kinase and response regulator CckA